MGGDPAFLRRRRGVGYLEDLARCGFRIGVRSISSELHYVPILSRGQSGLTSAPLLPHALQANNDSMSDNLTSSGQRLEFMAVKWLHL
jgi:hypothetical protein